jgi:hypothetical protein
MIPMKGLGLSKNTILRQTVERYLNSGDFNGLAVHGRLSPKQAQAIRELILADHLQLVSEKDYPNPHIRPWPSRRSKEDQLSELARLGQGDYYGFCLYPTSTAMRERLRPDQFMLEPYRRRLTEGAGSLELAYFEMEVLESYRNDPKYRYEFRDFQISFSISGEAYTAPEEVERDRIVAARVGIAYDLPSLDSRHIRRYLGVFLTDIAKFPPEHQRRWQTYEVPASDDIKPHPVWMDWMMGHWTDGHDLFTQVILELEAISQLFELAFGERLFRTVERPREWGWLIRSSSTEWHAFVHLADKLLSDNLSSRALDAAGAPRENTEGQSLGTLNRLMALIDAQTNIPLADVRGALKPLSDIRKLRQQPAHKMSEPVTDHEYLARQVEFLDAVCGSLEDLRELLARAPKTQGWVPDPQLTSKLYRM